VSGFSKVIVFIFLSSFIHLIVPLQRNASFVLVLFVVVLDNVRRNLNCRINVKCMVLMDHVCLEKVLACLCDGLISGWRIYQITGLSFLMKCGPVMVM
jgi:hypothetical protein